MVDYIYDGTFEGLLTCIYEHYYSDKASGIYIEKDYQPSFLTDSVAVVTDDVKAEKVYMAIKVKISLFDIQHIYRAFLSNEKEKEIKILRYVVKGFNVGSGVSSLHGDEDVYEVQKMEKKVYTEAERMRQFVRFSVMDKDVLYGKIEPDNDILELIADHFCDRFRNNPFIIHDIGREKALIAAQGQWYISDFDGKLEPEVSNEEKAYRSLWKSYFDNIAIMERKNTKCQRNHMPVRYHKHLTEVNFC